MTSAPAASSPARGRRVVLVTGLSGAGLSTALKVLEDLGHEAVDNLPLALVPALVGMGREAARDGGSGLAVGIDSRTRGFSPAAVLDCLAGLRRDPSLDVRLLFIDCDPETLRRRFTETRRRHPLAIDRPVADGIRRDQRLLWPLRDAADQVIDTSQLTPHDLRRLVSAEHGPANAADPFLFVMSFSFRRGLPREADLVFDVRFLANPYWDADLRPLTGLDEPVRRAIAADPGHAAFVDGLTGLLAPLLPRYGREGKRYLTIAFGCTGGQHRSVAMAEELAGWLRGLGHTVGVQHRDLPHAAEAARTAETVGERS